MLSVNHDFHPFAHESGGQQAVELAPVCGLSCQTADFTFQPMPCFLFWFPNQSTQEVNNERFLMSTRQKIMCEFSFSIYAAFNKVTNRQTDIKHEKE